MRDPDSTTPRVTAIIPTCRRPGLLARALRSIATQDAAPGEVVVVNDGPEADAPALRQVAEQSGCEHVVVIPNSRPPGPSGARNTGAAHARGEWLAFLDDDDEWLPAYQRTVLELVESCDLDVVCTDLVYRYDDGREPPGKPAFDELRVDLFLTRNPGLIGSNLVMRRALYMEVGGFDESVRCAEDMDLGVRLSLRGGVRYAPLRQRLVRHYQHTGPRICTPQGDAVRTGIRRFFELHVHRMTAAQREEFALNVRRLWGIDEYGELI